MTHPMTHDQLTDLTPEEIAALANPAHTSARRVIYVADTAWSALLDAQEGADQALPGATTPLPPHLAAQQFLGKFREDHPCLPGGEEGA